MLKAYKTEILPNPKQALKIRQTLGTGFFVTAFTFDKYVNHVIKK